MLALSGATCIFEVCASNSRSQFVVQSLPESKQDRDKPSWKRRIIESELAYEVELYSGNLATMLGY